MLGPWSVVTTKATSGSEKELRSIYGDHALITRVGDYNLIHLDSPDQAEVSRRAAHFDPEDLFEADCPLCQVMRREKVDVIYLGGDVSDE
ncbi:MAG: hypothetical protein ACE5JX_02985 [Acidobacteriota bacterium]